MQLMLFWQSSLFFFFSNWKGNDYRITSKLKLNRFCLGFYQIIRLGLPNKRWLLFFRKSRSAARASIISGEWLEFSVERVAGDKGEWRESIDWIFVCLFGSGAVRKDRIRSREEGMRVFKSKRREKGKDATCMSSTWRIMMLNSRNALLIYHDGGTRWETQTAFENPHPFGVILGMGGEARHCDMTIMPFIYCERISLFSRKLGPGGKQVEGWFCHVKYSSWKTSLTLRLNQ